MITQQTVAGLSNQEHQSKVMSEAQDLPDLKSKIDRLVSLETTEEATSEIRAQSVNTVKAAAARSSQYRKGKGSRAKKGSRALRRNGSLNNLTRKMTGTNVN